MTARERQRIVGLVKRTAQEKYKLRVPPLFWRLASLEESFSDALTYEEALVKCGMAAKHFMEVDLPKIGRLAEGLRPVDVPAHAEAQNRRHRGPYKKVLPSRLALFALIVEHTVPVRLVLNGVFKPPKPIDWAPLFAEWNRRHPAHKFRLESTMRRQWARVRNDERIAPAYASQIRRQGEKIGRQHAAFTLMLNDEAAGDVILSGTGRMPWKRLAAAWNDAHPSSKSLTKDGFKELYKRAIDRPETLTIEMARLRRHVLASLVTTILMSDGAAYGIRPTSERRMSTYRFARKKVAEMPLADFLGPFSGSEPRSSLKRRA